MKIPETQGPHVSVAALCETVIEDKQGVLTLVRIVDRVVRSVVGADPPTAMPPFVVPLQLVVALKPGAARGRHQLSIRLEKPDTTRETILQSTVLFEGPDRGSNVILNLNFLSELEGLHWFDVLLDDEQLLTRVPLRVVYQTQTTGSFNEPR